MSKVLEPMAPIIIHQTGKVASNTIKATLEEILPGTPVFHTHMLAESKWNSVGKRLRFPESQYLPEYCNTCAHQLEKGKRLREQIEEFKKLIDGGFIAQKLKVITLVREPVAIAVASFFQSLGLFFPGIEARCQTEPTKKIVAEIRDYYLGFVKSFLGQQVVPETLQFYVFQSIPSLISSFFDEEFKPVFNIDVYSLPFDYGNGYHIYEGKYARILLIRMENLNQIIHSAFKDFLGIEEFEIENKNIASEKFYKDVYSEFKNTISLPTAFVDRLYSSKLARHFYEQQELACFARKWTNSKQIDMSCLYSTVKPKTKCYFVTGTGRCGTKLFSRLFSLSNNSVCEHEKLFRHTSMIKFYQDNDYSSYLEDIDLHVVPTVGSHVQLNKSYGVASGHMYFSIPYLYRIFGKSVRFILLVRRPEEFVRSALARGFFDPAHPHSCMPLFPNPSDDMMTRWAVASPFEKCLWYWNLVNSFVLNQFRKMPESIYKIVRIEDVNVRLVKQLCEFLELSDVKQEAIEPVLAQRANASPGLGDPSDCNPKSLPISLAPVEEWSALQLGLLKQHTGELRQRLYGSVLPLRGITTEVSVPAKQRDDRRRNVGSNSMEERRTQQKAAHIRVSSCISACEENGRNHDSITQRQVVKSNTSLLNRNQYTIYFSKRCNYKCSYCCNKAGPKSPESVVEKNTDAIIKLFNMVQPGVILLSGGEPALWKDFPRILEALPQQYWVFSTNLSFIPPWITHPNVKLIIPAFHQEFANEQRFTEHLTELKGLDKRVHVKIIVKPGAEYNQIYLWEKWNDMGIAASLVPLEYTYYFKRQFLKDVVYKYRTCCLYNARFFRVNAPLNKLCIAGTEKAFQVYPDGKLVRCSQNHEGLGNENSASISAPGFNKENKLCRKNSCFCEWHHWGRMALANDNDTWTEYIETGAWKVPSVEQLHQFVVDMGWDVAGKNIEGSKQSLFAMDGKDETVGHICDQPKRRRGFEVFDSGEALAINKARQEHLASLGLDLANQSVLEVGCGVGWLTEFFEKLGCNILSTDARPENVTEHLRRHPHRRVEVADLSIPGSHRHLGQFDIIFCYGTLYHLSDPALCIKELSSICRRFFLIETCVHRIDNGQINRLNENQNNPNQSLEGTGCRPGRDWVMTELRKYFPFVYVTATQPDHPDFPLNWPRPVKAGPLTRSVFIASREPLCLSTLLAELPKEQKRLTLATERAANQSEIRHHYQGGDKHVTLPTGNRQEFQCWIDTIAAAQNRLYLRDQNPQSLSTLVDLVGRYKPTKIVELGTLWGLSLRAWLQAKSDAEIIAVDLSFRRLHESQQLLPVDLSRVKLLQQDILKTDFGQLWSENDKVILYVDAHDQPNVPIMAHILKNALLALPHGSVVAVDDLWYSPTTLSDDNAPQFFENTIMTGIDPLQCFDGYYSRYWKGGSFLGFPEVVPLMEWVNRNHIELIFEPGDKSVMFERPSRDTAAVEFDIDAFTRSTGTVNYNPTEGFSVCGDETQPANRQAVALCKKSSQLFASGEPAKAAECFQQALNISTDLRGAYYARAICLAQKGQLEAATSLLQREIETNSDHPNAHILLEDIRAFTSKHRQSYPQSIPPQKPQPITIFAVPKVFEGSTGVIQRNAIKSWSLLEPRPEIILLGNDTGVAEIAAELSLKHVPNIKRNEYGTPLLNSIFELAEANSATDWLVYVNSDVILMNDFVQAQAVLKPALEQLGIEKFLLTSQRRELDIREPIAFGDGNWQLWLRNEVLLHGILDYKAAVEMVFYSRGLFGDIPDFALGRSGWDDWLTWKARQQGAVIIDATEAFKLIHQAHDYSHAKDGWQQVFGSGPEAHQNRELAGNNQIVISDVGTHFLTPDGLFPGRLPDKASSGALVKRRISIGLERMQQGNYESALDYFDDAVHRGAGGWTPVHLHRARCLKRLGRFKEAKKAAEARLAHQSDDAEAKLVLQEIHDAIERQKKLAAGRKLQQGLEKLRRNNPPEALAHFERALAVYPKLENVNFARATAFVQLGKLGSAKQACQAELALQPSHAAAQSLLGRVDAALNEFAQMQEAGTSTQGN